MKMLPKNTENSFNGWSNYDTWNFKLWLDNSIASQKIVHNFIIKSIVSSKKTNDQIHTLRTLLEDYAIENAPELENSFYSDVLNASIRSVNYYQIADAYYYDYLEEHKNELKTA